MIVTGDKQSLNADIKEAIPESGPASNPSTSLPTYSEAVGSASPPPSIPPTNFLHLSKTNATFRDLWVIDPSLRMPEALLAPLKVGEIRPNLKLESCNGAISAEVHIVGSGEGKVRLVMSTTNGAVTAKVINPTPYKIHLHASTTNGSVTVRIPRTFTGPIIHKTTHGSVTFSPAMQPRLTTFSQVKNEARCFLGDWVASGFTGNEGDSWQGDEITAKTTNGGIRFYYEDEPKEDTAMETFIKGVKSWFSA